MSSPINSEYDYGYEVDSWCRDTSTDMDDSEPMDISPPSSPRQLDRQNEEIIQISENEVCFFNDIVMDNSICL